MTYTVKINQDENYKYVLIRDGYFDHWQRDEEVLLRTNSYAVLVAYIGELDDL